MHRGYLKLWRKTEESGLFQMPETFALFAFLLVKATHKPRKLGTPHGVVNLEAGQYVSGRLELASALRLSERRVRTCLDRLKNMEIIAIKSTSRYSIYTIVKYSEYQESDQQTTSQTPADDQRTTSKRPTDDQQATTKQEYKTQEAFKNEKNVKKKTKTDLQLALLCDSGIPEKLALQWLEIRKEKKLVLNETALQLTKDEAAKAGMTLLEAVTHCCGVGWGGFKSSWLESSGMHDAPAQTSNDQTREAARKIIFGEQGKEIESI